MPDGTKALDESAAYIVALDDSQMTSLENLLRDFKSKTKQDAIYLEIHRDVDLSCFRFFVFRDEVSGISGLSASCKYRQNHPLVWAKKMPSNTAPTIIIRHPKESPKKCSIVPLKGRDDIIIRTFPVKRLPALEGYVRLAADGPPLSEADKESGLLLLDCCWRRVVKMLEGVEDVPARSLNDYETAFPRVSKLGIDPDNGLASVEALFLAHHILGRPTKGLLDHYRWKEEFLKLNGLTE